MITFNARLTGGKFIMTDKIVFFIKAFCTLMVFAVYFMIIGCGTDAKPSFFINMVKDPSDVDLVSQCLTEAPADEGDSISINMNKQCLVDLSNGNQPTELTIQNIAANPALYFDKQVTFSAVVKNTRLRDDNPLTPYHIEVYTENSDSRFYIHNNAQRTLDFPLEQHEAYRFTCRIYEIKRHADWGTDSGN